MDFDAIQDLLTRVGKLQKEQGVFLDRMEKLKEKAGVISDTVYQNIQGDYRKQLDKLNTELYPLYDQLKIRKSELLKDIGEIEEALKEFMVEKEEISVRCELGEFTGKKAEKMIEELETANEDKFESLNKLKEVLGNVDEALSAEFTDDAVPEMGSNPSKLTDIPDLPDIPDVTNIDPTDDETPDPVELEDDHEDTVSDMEAATGPAEVDKTVLDMEAVEEGGSTVLFKHPTIHILSGDLKGTEFRLKMGVTNIGSDPGSDVVIEHVSISPQHAQVTFGPDGFTIFDYNTPTGIHVNGRKVIEHLLQNGDELVIGEIQVRFVN